MSASKATLSSERSAEYHEDGNIARVGRLYVQMCKWFAAFSLQRNSSSLLVSSEILPETVSMNKTEASPENDVTSCHLIP